jgi:transposase
LDVREILRRLQLGQTARAVARDLAVSRKTVARYQEWARERGLLSGPLPEPGELQRLLQTTLPEAPPPRSPFKAACHQQRIEELLQQGVECRAILERLKEEQGFSGSYSGLWRFVRYLQPRSAEPCIRIETAPGEEAQVDFGAAGRLLDPRDLEVKKAWVFVMTLSWSRHQYVEFVFDQEVATWLRCHRHAFEFFGGVPRRLVIDNLKAAIVRASFHDPVVQRAYRECAEHYGFLIAPCRPRTPQHKGKVEQGGVHYVKRNFLAGRTLRDQTEANRLALAWCRETAGQRIHGTVKERPLERFEQIERAALLALPEGPYQLAVWKRVKLHPDCHVVFQGAFYSAPHRLIGQRLWLRAADSSVTLWHEHQRIATHARALKPGQRQTQPDHLPPDKVVALMASPAWCLRRAREIGPQTSELIGRLLGERPLDRLRSAMGILGLTTKYGPRRLEAACARALSYDQLGYPVIKRILQQGLEAAALPVLAAAGDRAARFARPWTDFFVREA